MKHFLAIKICLFIIFSLVGTGTLWYFFYYVPRENELFQIVVKLQELAEQKQKLPQLQERCAALTKQVESAHRAGGQQMALDQKTSPFLAITKLAQQAKLGLATYQREKKELHFTFTGNFDSFLDFCKRCSVTVCSYVLQQIVVSRLETQLQIDCVYAIGTKTEG